MASAAMAKKDKKQAQPAAAQSNGKPSAIGNRAMLVGLSIRRWHPHKTDKMVSAEVADNHQADHSMGRYRKRLAAKEDFKTILNVINRLKNKHEFMTLPWSDEGYRILGAAGYFEYNKEIRALITEFDAAVQEFLPRYPQIKAEAMKRAGTMANEEDYPSVAELKDKFGIRVQIKPVPSGKDFRVDIGDEETALVRSAIEEETKGTIEAAMKDVWQRLAHVIEHASARLKAYQETVDGVEHPFRDSLITNITELLDVVPALNITGDSTLVNFAAQIRLQVTAYTAEQLRSTETLRIGVTEKADEILGKMAGFL